MAVPCERAKGAAIGIKVIGTAKDVTVERTEEFPLFGGPGAGMGVLSPIANATPRSRIITAATGGMATLPPASGQVNAILPPVSGQDTTKLPGPEPQVNAMLPPSGLCTLKLPPPTDVCVLPPSRGTLKLPPVSGHGNMVSP